MGEEQGICVMCDGLIEAASLSFEQRLIHDEDFCRTCWDEIMNGKDEELPLPSLFLEVS